VDRKVDRSQEPHEINVSSHTDPPDPPFEQHFPELSTLNEPTQAKQEKSLEKGGSVEPQESSNADEIEVLPTDPPGVALKPGMPVRVHCKGSKHDGKTGVVCKRLDADTVQVRLDDASLSVELRLWDCPISWLQVL
jgi:hypothetical protein